MVAGLLYVIGLIATLSTIVLVGYNAPSLIQGFNAALDSASGDIVSNILGLAQSLQWALIPFVGGLVLMGLGRIMMLLGSIDRALRGNA